MFFSHIKRQGTNRFPSLSLIESLTLGQRVSRCLDDPMQRKSTVVDSPNLCSPPKRYLPSVHEPPSETKLGDSPPVSFIFTPMVSYLMDSDGRCTNTFSAYSDDFKTKHPVERITGKNVSSTNEHKSITTINAPPSLSFLSHNQRSNYGSRLTSLKQELDMNTFDSIPNKSDLVAVLRNKNLRKSLARPPDFKIFSICIQYHDLKCKALELSKVIQMGARHSNYYK